MDLNKITCGQYSDNAGRQVQRGFDEYNFVLQALWKPHTLGGACESTLLKHTLNIYTICLPTAHIHQSNSQIRTNKPKPGCQNKPFENQKSLKICAVPFRCQYTVQCSHALTCSTNLFPGSQQQRQFIGPNYITKANCRLTWGIWR